MSVSINPTSATYYYSNDSNIQTIIDFGSATSVTSINDGTDTLVLNTDYTISGTILTILNSYLSKVFDDSSVDGEDITLTITFNNSDTASLSILFFRQVALFDTTVSLGEVEKPSKNWFNWLGIQFNAPEVFNDITTNKNWLNWIGLTLKADFYNLKLTPKVNGDSVDVNDCEIVDYTNLQEHEGNLMINKDTALNRLDLRIANPDTITSFTLKCNGFQDRKFEFTPQSGTFYDWEVPMNRIVSVFIGKNKAMINSNPSNPDNNLLL